MMIYNPLECVRLVAAFTLGDLSPTFLLVTGDKSPKVKAIINYRTPRNNYSFMTVL